MVCRHEDVLDLRERVDGVRPLELGRSFRIGGLVEPGSLQRDGTRVSFRVTDNAKAIAVTYTGSLPDLFREGKGVVAQGRIGTDGVFAATEVLAKHDENYMPPEAAEALRQAGHPMDATGPAGAANLK